MSTLAVNTITNAAGGNTATINGMTPTAQSLQGFRNRIINGDMRIDQRNNGASVSASDNYTVDRWAAVRATGAATMTAQQSTVAPAGFTNSLLFTIGTGAAPEALSQTFTEQRIEGFNFADLGWGTSAAQTITVSFWVRSSVTGTYGLTARNSSNNRAYVASYTVNAANTFEYKTVTIPGDTTGTWATNNSTGLRIMWDLGSGSGYSQAAGSWTSGSFISGLTGGVKLAATAGATFYITGVQLEAGSVATPFERRPYGTELQLAQRYYQVFFPAGQELIYNESNATGAKFWQLYLPVPMRATPTATYSSGMTGGSVIGLSGTISSLSLTSASVNRVSTRVTMSTNTGTANLIYHCDSFDGDSVGLASEL